MVDPLWLIIIVVIGFFVVREYGEWQHSKGRTKAWCEAMDLIHDPTGMNLIVCYPEEVVQAVLTEVPGYPEMAERIAANLIQLTQKER